MCYTITLLLYEGASMTTVTQWENMPDDADLSDLAGFVYLIEHVTTGRRYIGSKMFWTYRIKKVKGRRKRQKVESNWRKYKSSSKIIIEEIKRDGAEQFKFTILKSYPRRWDVHYWETAVQFQNNVLHQLGEDGTPVFYNESIAGKYYRRNVQFDNIETNT